MNKRMKLQNLLAKSPMPRSQRLALFALVTLGVIDSLARGVLTADQSIQLFFHAENCLFVRRQLRSKAADRIMSHGVQIADLFDTLPLDKARREAGKELDVIRSLCFKLLESKRLVA
jgi:hypothetical protein